MPFTRDERFLSDSIRQAGCLCLVVALLPFWAGCVTVPPAAARQIEVAHEAYLAHQYGRAEGLLSPVISEHRDKPEIAEALYLRALCRLQTEQRAKAAGDLDAALAGSKRADLTALIHAQLGILCFEDGRYDRAVEHYRRAERDLPEGAPTDRVIYERGVSLQRAGHFDEARVALAEVFMRFPASSYAPRARRAYKWKRDYFTVQCGAFTKIATAHETAARLRQKGYEALAVPETRDGVKLHVVHAGKHRTYAPAASAAAAIRTFVPDAFVVP
jgi:tetratricopeptide (TPR) repeat protein